MKKRNKLMLLFAAFSISFIPIAAVVSCNGSQTEEVQAPKPNLPNDGSMGTPINPDVGNGGDNQVNGQEEQLPPSSEEGESLPPQSQPEQTPPSNGQEQSQPDGNIEPDGSVGQQGDGSQNDGSKPEQTPSEPEQTPSQPEQKPEENNGSQQDLDSPALKALKNKINGIKIQDTVYEWDNVKFKIFTEPGSEQEFATVISIKRQEADGHGGGEQIQVPTKVGYPNADGVQVMIPVKAIGSQVFIQDATKRDDFVAKSVNHTGKSVWKVYLNDNVEYIFDGALSGLNNDHNSNIPFYGGNNLKWIGKGAFLNAGLGGVTIGENWNNLLYIGDAAFYDDWNITNLKISKSVEYIGEYAFAKLWKFQEATLPESFKNNLPSIFNVNEGDELLQKVKMY